MANVDFEALAHWSFLGNNRINMNPALDLLLSDLFLVDGRQLVVYKQQLTTSTKLDMLIKNGASGFKVSFNLPDEPHMFVKKNYFELSSSGAVRGCDSEKSGKSGKSGKNGKNGKSGKSEIGEISEIDESSYQSATFFPVNYKTDRCTEVLSNGLTLSTFAVDIRHLNASHGSPRIYEIEYYRDSGKDTKNLAVGIHVGTIPEMPEFNSMIRLVSDEGKFSCLFRKGVDTFIEFSYRVVYGNVIFGGGGELLNLG